MPRTHAKYEGGDGPSSSRVGRQLALESLDDGALGISTGMAYSPHVFADDRELTALDEVAASRDVVFAWHVRDYADELVESVRQALTVAEQTGCRIQISHLCAIGRRNWGKVADVLDLVQEVRSRGLDVRVDTYPYLAGNAPLSQLLPRLGAGGRRGRVAAQPAGRDRQVARHRRVAVRLRARMGPGHGAAQAWNDRTDPDPRPGG